MFLWLNLGMSEYAEIKIFLKFPHSRLTKSKKYSCPNPLCVNKEFKENYVFMAKSRHAGLRQNEIIL